MRFASAGGGSRTLMPPSGTPDFKSGASDRFRHPGALVEDTAAGRYVPGCRALTGKCSGPLPRTVSRNVSKAGRLTFGQIAMTALPAPLGASQAVSAILLPSGLCGGYVIPGVEKAIGVTRMAFGLWS